MQATLLGGMAGEVLFKYIYKKDENLISINYLRTFSKFNVCSTYTNTVSDKEHR